MLLRSLVLSGILKDSSLVLPGSFQVGTLAQVATLGTDLSALLNNSAPGSGFEGLSALSLASFREK